MTDTEKPPLPDITQLKNNELCLRLTAIRSHALGELTMHRKAIERAENGEVKTTEDLMADHVTAVMMAENLLTRIESAEYAKYVINYVAMHYRSDARKLATNFVPLTTVKSTNWEQYVSTRLPNDMQVRLQAAREFLHQAYETVVPRLEQAENGEFPLTTTEAHDLSYQMNIAAMLIPYTDNAEFLWEWRKAMIQKYRSPDRDMGDDFV